MSPALPAIPHASVLRARLDEKVFCAPPAAFRGTPFWAWNSRLRRPQLRRQIAQFAQMGFGGFHMHARTGLATPYFGDEFLTAARECVAEVGRRGMLAWLYDEDRWPSGFGGGLVTQDPRHRLKYVLFTPTPYNGTVRAPPNISCARAGRMENGVLLAHYAVRLRDGCLARYRRLAENEPAASGAEETEWFAYLETAGSVPWYNHQSYVDTLSPAALARFIAVTHERYQAALGAEFGKTIPAIFTDEPQHAFKECFEHAAQQTDLTIPATSDFFETFQNAHGFDLLDALPEVFWELPGGRASIARHRYHDHVTARFAQAYAAQLGAWCQKNGLLLTGHMMEEPTLFSQTHATGEAMRSLAHFQLPGIDMLCDQLELTTAKQAQSVARQYGRPGVMSELYGVTGWAFDFIGHKAQGDWQAALGVTVRVPHLAWLSMAGEAKRDYPASIHYQSPWWREYRLIEDHFARVNVVMTRGKPVARVAVIHPIETYWLCYGPLAQTKDEREQRERQFEELPRWLLGGLMDFDYLSEALLPGQTTVDAIARARRFVVGKMSYDAVVVPALKTLRSTTLERLEAFADAGGTVVFAGEIPALVDAAPSPRARKLAMRAARCAWDRCELLVRLESCRELDCADAAGIRCTELMYQLREDGPERHIFLCHLNRKHETGELRLRVNGRWRVFERDTFSGAIHEIHAAHEEGNTTVPLWLEAHGHKLLTLRPGNPAVAVAPRPRWRDLGVLADPVRVTLSEPNALLLDQAEWRWNDGAWQPREEILRLHNAVRARCNLPEREGHVAQPWTDPKPAKPLGHVALRFRFSSEVSLPEPHLAIEEPGAWRITLDGREVPARARGWWVDEAIRRVPLPALKAGRHELVLSRAFTRKTELEWNYLLGDFGVRLAGRHATLTAPVRRLAFGDWTTQGLPFYTGNVTYHGALTAGGIDALAVKFDGVGAALLTVALDGDPARPVAFAPLRAELGRLAKGKHRLDITAFGHRHNAFGPLHNTDRELRWLGPDAWRSRGGDWAYQYQLRPMGILSAPRIQSLETFK
ncbi:glycosyl hydrolase [Termitidicoccus mucosus]|uniref:Glycoside hydrolase n=1 Tax=Termitidicoccus mucosus TaxID=1184151 RepID=A0A178IL33_9BACT|nr:hypothetical protein AW736_07795 [Opitutaceae bacterium TSB47]